MKIRITNNKTGRFVKTIENDIATLVKDRFEKGNLVFNDPTQPASVKLQGRTILWPVAGILAFKYGVTQKVEVSHVKQ